LQFSLDRLTLARVFFFRLAERPFEEPHTKQGGFFSLIPPVILAFIVAQGYIHPRSIVRPPALPIGVLFQRVRNTAAIAAFLLPAVNGMEHQNEKGHVVG
jgi:hypothetical protein